ncbi:MAG: 16S rRNA (uracil(1498)-N(3))-methyltransferase [Desulfuromonadales bacterium]|nr:16S rRNA (uracil(1498)-N(3))-methyltransferase [Desulfuromonadales bacterium]MBN2793595.1 16S rRNA (uracil(1498)-N(3))-methyltransferase [Desulfuromonadales bacterium]
MRCFYLSADHFSNGDELSLPSTLQQHILRVLRLEPGTEIRIFNGFGLVAEAVLQPAGMLRVVNVWEQAAPPCQLTLIQGLPKGDKLELILQKGTELGVNRFVLVEMERSVSQIKSGRQEKRVQRWQKIIEEAARQARQYLLPELQLYPSLDPALQDVRADKKLVLWEESQRPLKDTLTQSQQYESVAVIVGPEGGLAAPEVELAGRHGYQEVSLGSRILRTETAGLAIMSILQYLYGDLAFGQESMNNVFVQRKG